MALLAVAAPTALLADPQFKGATALAASGTALTGNTGFTVPWVPGLAFILWSGATAAGVITLVGPQSPVPSPTVTVTAGQILPFGPISSQFANPVTGLIQVNVTTVTTASVTAFLIPNATGVVHNPFEVNPTIADY